MEITVLIFDLMDTVVADPFFHHMPKFFGMTMAELMAIKHPHSWPAFELGEIDEEEYFRRFFRTETGRSLDNPEELKAALFAAYRFVDGMEALLSELKQRPLRLWVHSNYSPWFFELRARLGLNRFFEGYAMSFELRARKPEARAFYAALEMIGARADECLFIDDRRENIDSARAIGLNGIKFESAPQLRGALCQLGILD